MLQYNCITDMVLANLISLFYFFLNISKCVAAAYITKEKRYKQSNHCNTHYSKHSETV